MGHVHTQGGEWVLQVLYLYTSIQKYLVHPKRALGKEGLAYFPPPPSSAITSSDLIVNTAHNLIVVHVLRSRELCIYPTTPFMRMANSPWNNCYPLEVLDLETCSNSKLLLFHLMYIFIFLNLLFLVIFNSFIHSTNIYYVCQAVHLELGTIMNKTNMVPDLIKQSWIWILYKSSLGHWILKELCHKSLLAPKGSIPLLKHILPQIRRQSHSFHAQK